MGSFRPTRTHQRQRGHSSSVHSLCGPPVDWRAVTSPGWPASLCCLSVHCIGTGPCHESSVKPTHNKKQTVYKIHVDCKT